MTAIVAFASRDLSSVSKCVKYTGEEMKFINSDKDKRITILSEISKTRSKIIAVVRDKKNLKSTGNKLGTHLYKETLYNLLDLSLDKIGCADVNIIIDSSFFIRNDEFIDMCLTLCIKHGKNLKRCIKGISQNESCIRIADFVSGAIWTYIVHSDKSYYDFIRDKTEILRM